MGENLGWAEKIPPTKQKSFGKEKVLPWDAIAPMGGNAKLRKRGNLAVQRAKAAAILDKALGPNWDLHLGKRMREKVLALVIKEGKSAIPKIKYFLELEKIKKSPKKKK